MASEYERRFLLPFMPDLCTTSPKIITQGYLSTDPAKTVRVRRMDDDAYITIKGLRVAGRAPEFEYPVPLEDALEMLALCGAQNTLSKNRHHFQNTDGLLWEVDCFQGRHEGLYIAELELPDSKTPFEKPIWLSNAAEITTDNRFANAALLSVARPELMALIQSALQKPSVAPSHHPS